MIATEKRAQAQNFLDRLTAAVAAYDAASDLNKGPSWGKVVDLFQVQSDMDLLNAEAAAQLQGTLSTIRTAFQPYYNTAAEVAAAIEGTKQVRAIRARYGSLGSQDPVAARAAITFLTDGLAG